jgi:hypothetical protein
MPSLGRTLLDALRGGRPADELARIAASYGANPTAAMAQSDVNRDVMPGAKTPDAALRDPIDAAQIDRYIWGQQAGLGGIPTAAYSELVKVPALQGAMRHVTKGIGKATGFPQAEEWYDTDETSSPPSVGNVLAFAQGALDAPSSPALAFLRGLLQR